MTQDMPRPHLPFLHRYRTKHGKLVWYVRRASGKIRIRAEYGSPEFADQYQAALTGQAPADVGRHRAEAGSLQWLWERYCETGSWKDLSAATRKQRQNIMVRVLKTSGAEKAAAIKKAHVVAGKDDRSDTPAQARNFLDALRGLFRWALEADHIKIDPTAGVKNPARASGQGFPVWSEDDVDRYEARWPIGTRERVWLDVLLYTGLRRGDAVTLGKQHVRGGFAILQTEKSRQRVTVTLQILPVLQATLDAGPCGDLAFICGQRGEALTKESFGNMFREACRKAGVNKSAHGVRKIGATRSAENGMTVSELEAVFGWQGGGMASLYTRAADRARLAKGAMGKIQRSIGSPDEKVSQATSIEVGNQGDKNGLVRSRRLK